jgi:hypothetical protein
MPTLEEIAYDAGRHALADQESIVSEIRRSTGTLLAAHALVASFLGAATLRSEGLHNWSWVALAALVAGLVVAATLLAPWRLVFAVDPHELYGQLYTQVRREVGADSTEWLAAAGFGYVRVRERNVRRVKLMSALSTVLAVLMVLQTLAWIAELLG